MNNIPLVSKADTQDINISLIAIKKAQQQLNDLINTADGKIKELNSLINSLNLGNLGGSGKYIQSIEQIKGQVSATVGELTDTISLNNTQPATSNGVAQAISSEADARNTAIGNAIGNLDVALIGGNGKYIESISETDGLISAVAKNTGDLSVYSANTIIPSKNFQRSFHTVEGAFYVRIAHGTWNSAGKIFIQLEGGNIADRIEITFACGNTNLIQCYGLFATNSYCVRNVIISNIDNGWTSNWDLWLSIYPYYEEDITIFVSNVAQYETILTPLLDTYTDVAPTNQQVNITLPQNGGFFNS